MEPIVQSDMVEIVPAEETPKKVRGRPKGSTGNHTERRRYPDRFAPAQTITLDTDLLPWEEQFAKWLASQTTRVDHGDELAAIRLLLGQDISKQAIKRTKRKLKFVQVYQSSRAEFTEAQFTLAKSRYVNTLPRAAKAHSTAVKLLQREMDRVGSDPKPGEPAFDVLPVLRAAPALLNPFVDRSLPKKTETQTTATQIIVNLTPEQARGLSAPIMVVESEEVLRIPPTTDAV